MSTTSIIAMASISIGCAIAEKVLENFGKSGEAQFIRVGGLCSIGATALTCVAKIFSEIKKLG